MKQPPEESIPRTICIECEKGGLGFALGLKSEPKKNKFLHVYKRRLLGKKSKNNVCISNKQPVLARCTKKESGSLSGDPFCEKACQIPVDLFPNILKCLPVISLCRFMCVCPSWNSFILHNFHSSPRRPIVGTEYSNIKEVSFYSFDANRKVVGAPNNLCTCRPKQPFIFLSYKSCNGLLCFREGKRKVLGVLNPASQEEPVFLPKNSEYFRRYHYRSWIHQPVSFYDAHIYDFGFDPLSQKFKVLGHTHYPICQIYTFDGKNKSSSWRSVVNTLPSECVKLLSISDTICINGILYWFSDKDFLISFDLASETFHAIQGPKRVEHEGDKHIYGFSNKGSVPQLFEYDGRLCLVNLYSFRSN
ncbi:hypothetical protein ACHQM5_024413 [Ranunculus cassubicifolius]